MLRFSAIYIDVIYCLARFEEALRNSSRRYLCSTLPILRREIKTGAGECRSDIRVATGR